MKCPLCKGKGFRLGQLGNLIWYRCRACGMEFCKKVRVKKHA